MLYIICLSLPESYLGQMKEVPGSSGENLSLLMEEPQQTQACGYPVGVTAALIKAVMTVMLGGHGRQHLVAQESFYAPY